MNFSTDGLDAPASRREDGQPTSMHYTTQFHIYQKQKTNAPGMAKRAKCIHCGNDWAYNETRLKHHITDVYRGCRQIPNGVRERVRAADGSESAAVIGAGALPSQSSPAVQTPQAKRKRESSIAGVTPIQNQPSVVPVAANSDMPVGMGAPADSHTPPVRVAVEFSMTSGSLLRATWIAAELISEFHQDIVDVALIPRSSESTFNIWIGGKIAWSRGVGQPLPDYDHLRPIVRAQCCTSTL